MCEYYFATCRWYLRFAALTLFLCVQSFEELIMSMWLPCTFSSDQPKTFLLTFWITGSKNLQKSWIRSVILSAKLVASLVVTVFDKFVWTYVYKCIYVMPKDNRRRFLNFWFFFSFFSGTWSIFEVKSRPLPNRFFYSLYGVNKPFLDNVFKRYVVQKFMFFEILHLFMILCDLNNFSRWNTDQFQIDI